MLGQCLAGMCSYSTYLKGQYVRILHVLFALLPMCEQLVMKRIYFYAKKEKELWREYRLYLGHESHSVSCVTSTREKTKAKKLLAALHLTATDNKGF